MIEIVLEALKKAWELLVSFDAETYQIIGLSLFVSTTATLLASLIGMPIGMLLSAKNFRGKGAVIRIIYMFMSMPPVIMGLVVFLILSRNGPLGVLKWLYTPKAMVIAQLFLVLPIIIGQMYGFAKDKSGKILLMGKTLGANRLQRFFLLAKELRPALFMTFTLGFGRAMSEVGAIMLVGGNIKGKTRAMTTSIATLMGMGEYEKSFAFGIVLLLFSFVIQSVVYRYQGEGGRRAGKSR